MGGSGRASLDTHPNDDKTVVRMGHPVSWAPITLISRHAAVVPRLLFGEAFFDGLGYVFDGGVLGELADFGVVGFFVEAHLGGDVTVHAEDGGDLFFGEEKDLEHEVIALVGAAAEAGLADEDEAGGEDGLHGDDGLKERVGPGVEVVGVG